MRPWGGKRTVMRDPSAPGWPDHGDRTEIREDAEQWRWAYLDLIRTETRRHRAGLGRSPRPMGEAVEAFLEHRRRTVEPTTASVARTGVAHLLRHFGTVQRTSALTGPALQELAESLLGEGYEASTVRLYVSIWRTFIEWCAFGTCGKALRDTPAGRARLRQFYDPTMELSLPSPGSGDVPTLSDDEVQLVLQAAAKVDGQLVGSFPSAVLAVGLGLFAGMRQGEIFAARWQDVRAGERTVRIQWQVAKDRTDLKALKGKSARTALMLPGWWDLHRPDSVGLICGRTGRPVGARTQRNLVTRVLDTAGLNAIGLGWHLFRHTYCRMFLESGGRMQELQRSLGHSSIVTTETRYGHFHEDVAARLARERIYGA